MSSRLPEIARRAWTAALSRRCWALELGPTALRLVGLRRTPTGASLEELACSRLLPDGRSVTPAEYRVHAQETLAAWRRTFRLGRESRLAVVVPALRGIITTLHLPRVDAARLDELARLEVEGERPQPQGGEERVVAWRAEAGPTETTGRTLIAAWPRAVLASYLDLLDSAGLSADRLTFAPLADRAFLGFLQHHEGAESWRPDDNLWTLRVGESLIDWSRSTYEGFHSVTRTGGLLRLHQLLQQELGLDAPRARALAEDLERGVPPPNAAVQLALDLYLDELVQKLVEERDRRPLSASPRRLVLLGSGGSLHGLAARLEKTFDVAVKHLAHFPRVEICEGCDGHLRTELGDFVPAIGAALALEWEAAPIVDLAPRDRSKAARRGSTLRLALAGGLLLSAGWLETRRADCGGGEKSPPPQLIAARAGQARLEALEALSAELERRATRELAAQRARAGWLGTWSGLPDHARILGVSWSNGADGTQVELELDLPRPSLPPDTSPGQVADALLAGVLAPWLHGLRGTWESSAPAVPSDETAPAAWEIASEATRSAPDAADPSRWRLSVRLENRERVGEPQEGDR